MKPGTALKCEVKQVLPAGHEKGDADASGQGHAKLTQLKRLVERKIETGNNVKQFYAA